MVIDMSYIHLWVSYTLNHIRYNLHNFLSPLGPRGIEFRGPLWTPTRLIVNATVWSFAFGVPLLYLAIFRFRRTEADNINIGICPKKSWYLLNLPLTMKMLVLFQEWGKKSNICQTHMTKT